MKYTDYLAVAVIALFITVSAVAVYDMIKEPPQTIKVVDIGKILSKNEEDVLKDKMTIEEYKSIIGSAEELIRQEGLVLSRYITINNTEYPLVFGGSDITENVLERMGALK